MNQDTYDALIVGAGLTGLLAGYTLSKNGLKVAIIDKSDFLNPNKIIILTIICFR